LQNTKIGKKLIPYDKTLYDLNPVKKFIIKIGLKDIEVENKRIKIIGSTASKIIGGAALRTPVLLAGL